MLGGLQGIFLNTGREMLTGSLSLSGILSMESLELGRDKDSLSSLDLRRVSYIALVDGVRFSPS